MKFLIQKINNKIVHDFAFTLLESIRFDNWLTHNIYEKFHQNKKDRIIVKFINYIEVTEPDDIYPIQFKPIHKNYIPIGSVKFVLDFLHHFYGLTPKPINVPNELFEPYYSNRPIYNGTEKDRKNYEGWFVKSNDIIKSDINGVLHVNTPLEVGNYQFSMIIPILSEWRAFVYQGKLVGLQNYSGDFTKFPDVTIIENMIRAYKSAPVAYTLDVGVNSLFVHNTFVIEVHDFFSCGLYGFANHKILPHMFNRWFREYIIKNI